METNTLKVKVINDFLNLLVIDIAHNYLNKLKKDFKAKEIDEIILKFLDNSVFLAEKEIDIRNNNLNEKIVRMPKKMKEKFEKAIKKQNSYSNMCKKLNFIYVIIKEKDKQELLFQKLYNWYDKNEDNIIENEKIDIYKEIKPWLLTNSFYKSKAINY